MMSKLFVLFLLIGQEANEDPRPTFAARVIEVKDGDTLFVVPISDDAAEKEEIRIHAVDTPEWDPELGMYQTFGKEAGDWARELLLDKKVMIDPMKKDFLGRTVASVTCIDGEGYELKVIKAGMAWWYEYYSPTRKDLGEAQDIARRNKLGLWGAKYRDSRGPMNPAEFRRAFFENRENAERAKKGV